MMKDPPLLREFYKFCADLLPKRVILTHLEEFGRDADDYWDREHAQKVETLFSMEKPNIQVSAALLGDQITL